MGDKFNLFVENALDHYDKKSDKESSIDPVWDVSVDQEITSAGTSINKKKLPRTFTLIKFKAGTVNADIGGGKFDNVTEYLGKLGVENIVYDPFNRSLEHNNKAISRILNGQVDTVTVNNVLNVIQNSENRDRVIKQAANVIKPDGIAYFLIYTGDETEVGKVKAKGKQWQENRKPLSYKDEIQKHFKSVNVNKNGLIIATGPKTKNQNIGESFNRNNKFNLFVENALDHYGVKNDMIDAAFKILQKIKSELGEEALIVGGSVRDWIIQQEFKVTPEQVKEKILEMSTMKENKFNEYTRALLEHLKEDVTEENCSAGGAMSVFGDVTATATQFSGDTYATGDSRMPKALGKGVMRRNAPELTVFATGVIKKKRKSKKNGKQKQAKRKTG